MTSNQASAEAPTMADLSAHYAVHDHRGLRYLASKNPSQGPTLVLLPGRGHAAPIWWPLLTRWATDFNVFAFDVPSDGEPPPPATPWTFFAAPVDDFLRENDLRDVTVVGHSLGGFAALALGLSSPERVARMALIDAMGLGPHMAAQSRMFFRATPERIATTVGRKRFGRINPLPKSRYSDAIAAMEYAWATTLPVSRTARDAFACLVPVTGALPSLWNRLPEVTQPVFLLWGRNDRTLPVSLAREAVKRLPSAKLRELEAGHAPHLEHPDIVDGIVRAWLKDEGAAYQ